MSHGLDRQTPRVFYILDKQKLQQEFISVFTTIFRLRCLTPRPELGEPSCGKLSANVVCPVKVFAVSTCWHHSVPTLGYIGQTVGQPFGVVVYSYSYWEQESDQIVISLSTQNRDLTT